MKKRICWWWMLLAVFLIGGCVPSLYPLYTDDELVLLPGLEGIWRESSGEIWTFSTADPESKTYQLTHCDEALCGRFKVHIVELEGRLFWDLYPEEAPALDGLLVSHLLPVHSFAQVDLAGGRLEARFLDEKRLTREGEGPGQEIEYKEVDDLVILTASTSDLQEFAVRWADTDVFGRPLVLNRLDSSQ